jgi:hypothetical protein
VRFQLSSDLQHWIRDGYTRQRSDLDEPLWLELRSSGQLAIVPWEQLLSESIDTLTVRIPNFAVAPRFIDGDLLRLAICASSPSAKTPFPVAPYVQDLVRNLQSSGIPRTQVHLFTDVQAHAALHQLRGASGHDVVVHDPQEAESFGIGATRSDALSEPRITSPWLRWMHGCLMQAPVDAVHFACPGFFYDTSGALALARSPLVNDDPLSSHFIGARELCNFLTSVGALSVGFSQPNETVWNLGLRLVSDQIAQLRPGPVILHQDPSTDAPIARVYGFLFAPTLVDLPRIRNLALYVHPKYFERFAYSNWITSSDDRFSFAMDAPAALSRYVLTAAKRDAIEPEDPLWRRSMQLATDQAISEIATSGIGAGHRTSAQEGTSRALDLIQSVMGKVV